MSSPRGAIQKRPGSTVFAAGASGTFPNLGVTDSFTRVNEDPLSNGGKWSVDKHAENTGIGRVFSNAFMAKFLNPRIPAEAEVTDSFERANENPLAKDGKGNEAAWENFHAWSSGAEKNTLTTGEVFGNQWTGGPNYCGALYNVGGEQFAPYVIVDVVTPGTFFLWISKKAAKTEGYCLEVTAAGTLAIRRIKGGVLEDSTIFEPSDPVLAGDKYAITVREGRVSSWRKRSGGWEQRNSTTDSTFNSGYGGFSTPAAGAHLKNFAIGTTENAPSSAHAYWNVAEQTNPAASVFLSGTPVEGGVSIETSMNAAGTQGYLVEYEPEFKRTRIYRRDTLFNSTVLLTTAVTFSDLDGIGVSVRNGVVTAWKQSHVTKIWAVVGSVSDATYNKGFSGVGITNNGNAALTNFSVGEIGPAPAEALFTSLLPCNINGTQYLIAASGTRLYSITTAGEINEIKAGVEEGTRWSIIQAAAGTRVAQGPVYLSNGVDPPQYWTGASKTTLTAAWTSKPEGEFADITVFKPKYLTYHANRIWAGGLSGDESAVRFSGLATVAGEGEKADPTSWPKENVVWFEKDNGNPITGLGTVGPYVVVFKNHQTWVIYNMDEGENRQISDTIGCISNRSIVETHIGTFFLTPDQGIYLTNGSTLKEVSRNVKPILQGTDSNKNRAAKQDELKNTAGGYLNGHYYLSYMAQDGSMKTLDYDTVLNSWWLHDLAGNQWVAWEPTTGNSSLYTVPNKAKAGVVKAFVPGVYQDSGANYVGARGFTAFWLSSWEPFWQYFMRHRFQQPQIRKRIRTLFVDGKGELTTVVFKKFGTAFEELSGVVELGDQATLVNPVDLGEPLGEAGVEYQPVRYYALGTSRIWSFGFGNKSANFFEVDSYAADLSFRKS